MITLPMGTIVELKIPCMGNEKGSKGICYDTYNLDEPGSSFIFENGEYCGFSIDEQNSFFKVIRKTDFQYSFKNALKLSEDFRAGIFNIMNA